MPPAFEPHAVVRLRASHPDHDRLKQYPGVVPLTLDPERGVHEVEFADDEGRTVDILTVNRSDLDGAGERG